MLLLRGISQRRQVIRPADLLTRACHLDILFKASVSHYPKFVSECFKNRRNVFLSGGLPVTMNPLVRHWSRRHLNVF